MKIASIDIGTNSMRLLIADYNKTISNRKKIVNTTRMGQGINESGIISNDAIKRNLDSFISFVNTAKNDKKQFQKNITTLIIDKPSNRD